MTDAQLLNLVKAICSRVREKEGYLNKTKLIKYLYLIDIEYYRRHKETFTGFKWIFYDFGPWAYEYNQLFEEMSSLSEFEIKREESTEHDAYFISCDQGVEFERIFKDLEDELSAKRIVDKWVGEPLNSMLNYVYFKTEPMVDAERYKPLDFTKIHALEAMKEFRLTKGIKNLEEKTALQRRIKERLLSMRKTQSEDTTFTLPQYDDIYFDNIQRMNREDED